MFTESAAFYDLVYSFKNYQKEAEEIIAAIKAIRPDCKTILDIGCGTAEHHRYLKNAFQIDGLDINQDFINSAKAKNEQGAYFAGDMADFNLNKKYDVLTCLFSSIGYVKTTEKLLSTLNCFNAHLYDKGLVIVEPWLRPDPWENGKLYMLTHEKDDIKICRMNISESKGNLSIINFHYLLGTPDNGVKHFEERHELALFTKEEMMDAFEAANFEVTHDEQGLTGRGMYYGIKKPTV